MSPQKCQTGLFIFHRDLRIQDNVGLIEACKRCKQLYVCFIFTPEQITEQNKYRSQNAIQFMIESLVELHEMIRKYGGSLITMYGSHVNSIAYLITKLNIECVYFNRDYTPYAIKRDKQVLDLCKNKDVKCEYFEDYYLYPPGTVATGSGMPYKKYTHPFITR